MPSLTNLTNKFYSASGANGIFVKINEEIGIKFLASRKYRDLVYCAQKKGEYIGIAPKVYGKVKKSFTIDGINFDCFGYFTEVVKPLGDSWEYRLNQHSICKDFERKWAHEIHEICDNDDIHIDNLGETKEGNIVFIDWDVWSKERFKYIPFETCIQRKYLNFDKSSYWDV